MLSNPTSPTYVRDPDSEVYRKYEGWTPLCMCALSSSVGALEQVLLDQRMHSLGRVNHYTAAGSTAFAIAARRLACKSEDRHVTEITTLADVVSRGRVVEALLRALVQHGSHCEAEAALLDQLKAHAETVS